LVAEIEPRQLAEKMAAGEALYLVNVRQPWEHETAALPGSLLIPLNELRARSGEIRPPGGALVVVYCHHGIRSLHGAAFLRRLGLANVVSLAGGLDAWSLEVDPGVRRY
jgi:rhodanese-related sulfurtransferase